ncbi:helix-turn-helix domain-containing protein [Apilactobacillus xinyiensis]|uniref:helix-turn-helix domain-containing protein n=1 Tax=Apilactobacillus xinyiensis TaxID=2841032 RepID=UPI00200D0D89|nr:helix-turn-helix domain-containing protein [Apilactobacillus xinyiensis]MCL0329829.1 helix-turn-helix domain-containing protein [Apilactobacillus xinyiensis]
MNSLGRKLNKIRSEKGVEITDVAKELKISSKRIEKIEKGYIDPQFVDVLKLTSYYKVSLGDFYQHDTLVKKTDNLFWANFLGLIFMTIILIMDDPLYNWLEFFYAIGCFNYVMFFLEISKKYKIANPIQRKLGKVFSRIIIGMSMIVFLSLSIFRLYQAFVIKPYFTIIFLILLVLMFFLWNFSYKKMKIRF